jgi:hypothetical protein
VVIGPVNHGYLELVCCETVCGIRAIKDLLRPVRRGSWKGVVHIPWFMEPPKKALEVLTNMDDIEQRLITYTSASLSARAVLSAIHGLELRYPFRGRDAHHANPPLIA